MVFWHSSAHVLGECLECNFGGHLCIGPPTEEGFYYDAYLGENTLAEPDFAAINAKAEAIAKEKQAFERLVLTKAEALRMFADNVFKSQLIAAKIPDGGYTTAYRCGPLIDLCRGPHVPSTAAIKAFEVMRTSAAYWLGNAANDSLQRVYGVSFPDAKQLKAHKHMLEEAKKRDHRVIGGKQDLFFFHELSPGSCFFLPHGARIYNKLMDFIRAEYRKRGYTEVITPNMFNIDLWRISGHAEHYLENMFTFGVEGADFGLKPMNCPGHCLMFDVTNRSYKGARARARGGARAAAASFRAARRAACPPARPRDPPRPARPRRAAPRRPPLPQSCPSASPTLACCTATSFRARCRA
jgi:threonyl-tRNA synthetase